jgi:signal transduction histidine kinase
MAATRTSKMFRLKVIGIIAPLAFGVTLGLFTELLLRSWISARLAQLIATGILTASVIAFSLWMFSRLEDLQARLDLHRRRQARQVTQMARMEERERIGLELHDGVIQDIYGVQLKLDACISDLKDEASVSSLDEAVRELTDIIGRMRQYIFALQPTFNSGIPLSRALSDLLEAAHANGTAETEFHAEEGTLDRLGEDEAGALFQLANEGVASAISRGATQVKASVTADEESVCLQLSDNGRAAAQSTQTPNVNRKQLVVKVVSHDGSNLLTANLPFAASAGRA